MSLKTRLWTWIAIGVLSWMAVRTFSNIIRLYEAGGRVNKVEKELGELEVKKRETEMKLAESQKDEYKERIAREKLGLGLPGEVVVIMDSPEVASNQLLVTSQELNWQKWRRLYLGF